MQFRHIVAIVVSSFVVFAVVFLFILGESGAIPPVWAFLPFLRTIPPVLAALSLLLTTVTVIIGAILLFVYGIRGRKIQPQDKASKEDITRLEDFYKQARKEG